MTDVDTEAPVKTRPPTVVIVIGFEHAVGGGVGAVLLFLGLGLRVLTAGQRGPWRSSLPQIAAGLTNPTTLMVLAIVGFLIATFFSGLWLLRTEQRGRRLTIALACIAFPFQGADMAKSILISGEFARMHFIKAVAVYWGELGFMAYCVFVLAVMYWPSVRCFYAAPQPTSGTEDAAT